MDGLNFGMDGFCMDNSRWYNPSTGDKFTVKQNYFEDNVMKIQAMDGRIFTLDQMANYLQWQGEGEPPMPEKLGESKGLPGPQCLPPEVANILEGGQDDGLLPEDAAMIAGMGSTSGAVPPRGSLGISRPAPTPNHDIIQRALAKCSKPEWNLAMKWSKFPEREMSMLLEVMDVPVDEISNYYMDSIRTEFDAFMDNLRDQFNTYIASQLGIEIKKDEPVAPIEEEKPVKSKRTNGKTKK